jgi:hypothetical protein
LTRVWTVGRGERLKEGDRLDLEMPKPIYHALNVRFHQLHVGTVEPEFPWGQQQSTAFINKSSTNVIELPK